MNGYDEKAITSDIRWKLIAKLEGAGLTKTPYGRHMVENFISKHNPHKQHLSSKDVGRATGYSNQAALQGITRQLRGGSINLIS